MQLRNVRNSAQKAGVGLDDVTIKIDRNPEMIGTGYTGHASGNTITLYPDAFSSKENLVKTLGHERMHIYQESVFGSPSSLNLVDYETGAILSEDAWWQYFLKGGK